ncbi:proline--tRNA ligase [Paenibacillus aurantius]|uniref:Proline--tRNA ligase n=1 Tax=Paenibacillus aurantius TaxID=2918900 RepID=A0AA96LI58_9BACL|nr:proline--tRNA ligase [Paenibacillus aurantius]WNQ12391.1 proline--tRNA ligase [Paenibacillus aurantius]
MRQSTLLGSTMREAPAEAEAVSHRLLLRAGFIRQLAAGIYTYLPLGRRTLRKLEGIVREEMNRAGAQEVLLPALQPAELWEESGRYAAYGPELMRLKDRHDREFVLGPTHEEVITALIAGEVKSYRRLPLTLYQIQTKFRDERRPRFGLLRGREFLMKDAYSFDADAEGLDRTYWRMHEAYHRMFTRMGLNFRAVEADAGTIGGEGGTHEFMALAAVGEDTIVSCTSCGYAANLEKAESAGPVGAKPGGRTATGGSKPEASPQKIHTPGWRTIGELTAALGVEASGFIKTLIYVADGKPVAVLVRGDDEVNETKLKNFLDAEELELADAETTRRVTGAPVGFAGPVGLSVPLVADEQVAAMPAAIAGANEEDYHLGGLVPGRDFSLERTADLRNVKEGEGCPRCGAPLAFSRGIEMGHIFKLGTKYSEKLGARYLDASGRERTILMGCYGIGISRLLSAIVEQHHDGEGIRWPMETAPFHVHLIPVSGKDETQIHVAEELYRRLHAEGLEVLLDDRDERFGVKMKDADLIGLPFRIVIGKEAGEGRVEVGERGKVGRTTFSVEEAVQVIREQTLGGRPC